MKSLIHKNFSSTSIMHIGSFDLSILYTDHLTQLKAPPFTKNTLFQLPFKRKKIPKEKHKNRKEISRTLQNTAQMTLPVKPALLSFLIPKHPRLNTYRYSLNLNGPTKRRGRSPSLSYRIKRGCIWNPAKVFGVTETQKESGS